MTMSLRVASPSRQWLVGAMHLLFILLVLNGCVIAEEQKNCVVINSDGFCILDDDEATSSLTSLVANCSGVICIITQLVTVDDFRNVYWEQQPLLFHTQKGALGKAQLNFQQVLPITEGLVWSGSNYLLDSNATTMTPNHRYKNTPMVPSQVKTLSQQHTIILGSIQTLHRGAAELVLHFQRGLGMTANGDVRINSQLPLHTDRRDLFVIQTAGQQRITVFDPLVELPVWGVHGSAQWGHGEPLPRALVKEPVLQATLKAGDMIYIPRGFVYTTSRVDSTTSIDITVALHTEAHHLVLEKLLRCALARSGFCTDTTCPIGLTLTQLARSSRPLRQALPLGFLHHSSGWMLFAKAVADPLMTQVVQLVQRAKEDDLKMEESLLKELDNQLPQVAGRVFESVKFDLKTLEEETWAENNDEIPYHEKQQHWQRFFAQMGAFQGDYCHKGGPKVFFQDYFSPDLKPDNVTAKILKVNKKMK
jgi:hypothetical protein